MTTRGFIIFSLVLMFTQCSHAQFVQEAGIMVLTDENFDLALNQHKLLMVEFYASWCEPCKEFAPDYQRIAEKLTGEKLGIEFAKIDGSIHKFTNRKYKLQAFPSFKLYIDGFPLDFTAVRAYKQMYDFLKAAVNETLIELKAVNEAQYYLEEYPVSVVYFMDSKNDYNRNIFNIASKQFLDIAFFYTLSNEVKTKYSSSKSNKIILFKKDGKREEYLGSISIYRLVEFIEENAYPAIQLLDSKVFDRIFQRQKNSLIIIENKNEESIYQKKVLYDLAPLIMKRVQVVVANPTDPQFGQLLDKLGTFTVNYPDIFYFLPMSGQNGLVYRYKEPFTPFSLDNVLRFMDKANVGRIEHIYKSQKPPSQQNGFIMQVVGDTYKNIIEGGQDIFIEFHVPQSKSCQTVQPEFVRLAESLSVNSNILCAQIDANLNDVATMEIQHFPTFKFYRANDTSSPIDYDGEFKYDNFLQFLELQTSFPWAQPDHGNSKINENKYDL